MAVRCFYHSADLDGHCSGAIVKHFVPEAILYPINYGDEFPWGEVAAEDTVYMVDFCLQPFSDMQKLASKLTGRGALVWMDHHKTAIEEWQRSSPEPWFQALVRTDLSACEITWLFFTKDPAPLAVTLLGRYDVWDHSDLRTLPFQYRMRMEDTDPLKGENAMGKWEALFLRDGPSIRNHFGVCAMSELVDEGKLLLRYEEQQNVKVCRAYAFETSLVVPISITDQLDPGDLPPQYIFRTICLNRGMTNSKVFDSVYDPTLHHLMITFCRLPRHKQAKGGWAVGLYSTRDDVDCGAIAKALGGGGHKGAAGFQCNVLPFQI